MAFRFRPRLEGLEARETPTSIGFELLGTVPNPAQNVSARQLEASPPEAESGLLVEWSGAASAIEPPTGVEFAAVDDSVWSGWAAENQNQSAESLVSDWVFTEQANTA